MLKSQNFRGQQGPPLASWVRKQRLWELKSRQSPWSPEFQCVTFDRLLTGPAEVTSPPSGFLSHPMGRAGSFTGTGSSATVGSLLNSMAAGGAGGQPHCNDDTQLTFIQQELTSPCLTLTHFNLQNSIVKYVRLFLIVYM